LSLVSKNVGPIQVT